MCISSVEQGKRNMESDARRWLYKYFRIDFLSNKLKGFSLSYRTANYIIFSQISTPCLQLAKHCSLYVEALNNAYLLSIHGNPPQIMLSAKYGVSRFFTPFCCLLLLSGEELKRQGEKGE